MSSTIPNKAVFLLYERQTNFLSLFEKEDSWDLAALGEWLIEETSNIGDYCTLHGILRPDVHIIPGHVSQKQFDKFLVDEFLKHDELQRKSS